MSRRVLFGLAAAHLTACGLSTQLPETRDYQLARPPAAARPADPGGGMVTIQAFEVAQAYDDDRIVYRASPVRFDFYEYHRWSSRPGEQIADYLREAYDASGRFCAVVRRDMPGGGLTLGGRVIALEELDVTPRRWLGRVEIELWLTDEESGQIVWRRRTSDQEPVRARNPEGLARALSVAMERIAARTAPALAAAARARPCAPPAHAAPAGVREETMRAAAGTRTIRACCRR